MNAMNYRIMPTLLAEQKNTLNFITYIRRNKYDSLPKLYEAIKNSVRSINSVFNCHLITYPYVSVMVECGDSDLLNANLDKIKEAVESKLWEYMA